MGDVFITTFNLKGDNELIEARLDEAENYLYESGIGFDVDDDFSLSGERAVTYSVFGSSSDNYDVMGRVTSILGDVVITVLV